MAKSWASALLGAAVWAWAGPGSVSSPPPRVTSHAVARLLLTPKVTGGDEQAADLSRIIGGGRLSHSAGGGISCCLGCPLGALI